MKKIKRISKTFLILVVISIISGFLRLYLGIKWIPLLIAAIGTLGLLLIFITSIFVEWYLEKHPEKLEELKRNNHQTL